MSGSVGGTLDKLLIDVHKRSSPRLRI